MLRQHLDLIDELTRQIESSRPVPSTRTSARTTSSATPGSGGSDIWINQLRKMGAKLEIKDQAD